MTKGFDVLHIKVKPQQLLWPIKTQQVTEQVLDFVGSSDHRSKPLLVHGFSVGGYVYGETLVKILTNRKYTHIGNRIRGQIFDSPVDFEGVPRGTGMALSSIPVVQQSIRFSLEMFFNTFKDQTMTHFHNSSEAFCNNELKIPTLILHSLSDPVGIPGPILDVYRGWQQQGVQVYRKCWKSSYHVSHFAKYPIEYIEQLNSFLQVISFIDNQEINNKAETETIQEAMLQVQ